MTQPLTQEDLKVGLKELGKELKKDIRVEIAEFGTNERGISTIWCVSSSTKALRSTQQNFSRRKRNIIVRAQSRTYQ